GQINTIQSQLFTFISDHIKIPRISQLKVKLKEQKPRKMETISITILIGVLPILIVLLIAKFRQKQQYNSSSKQVPPGSLGIPVIGQSLQLLWAMRSNTAEKFLEQRIQKYGPISKLSLFGKPTVFIHGKAANKLVFTGIGVGNSQTKSVRSILGEKNLLELGGEEHKRVRGAMASFLKAESLKEYVGKMDQEVRLHIRNHWEGKHQVQVLPLMKVLTFDIICSLLFGVERGPQREELVQHFQEMICGMWSIPIDLPFTRYNRSLASSSRVDGILRDLIAQKRSQLDSSSISTQEDLITSTMSALMSEREILDNIKLVMTAGHDTSSAVITLVMRLLSNQPRVYSAVLQEQEEISKSKGEGGEALLTWEDLGKMKYTWRVAQETMRMYPPLFGGFRVALEDIHFQGYLIPKGWQIFWASAMTHMDSTIFPEPDKFEPTRFENPSSIPPYCYIPFGGGARICPGYEFAKVEILVTIHYLVTQFTWKMCADNGFIRDPMPVPTKGLPITIQPRNINPTF
ncbi:Cytochrome P450 716B1, partial [Linum grandiflorum]